ncbi:hypothetical protein PPTG_24364 [Phytophthora nicotianae INRA-310]|uniref:Uncharacterized protein n=3 Tax=Phytophthora nicotianae TaxID=4792 RepID=W2PGB3_PHYN3|nr:hypothetical protein PPTG_24364 [Phytophthora nicotianae INRA-310]ETI31950.1 hypothetical protein F443_21178 [Phytophthora nicotianae P1569]ETM32210.1 hypothetical protein L914_20339 [Phytophthora nicotianae]ETM99906.1 hypothetical protein PPTG_24364 [Phytophthora nicotianae INRA-310]
MKLFHLGFQCKRQLVKNYGSFNLAEIFNRPSLIGRGGSDLA